MTRFFKGLLWMRWQLSVRLFLISCFLFAFLLFGVYVRGSSPWRSPTRPVFIQDNCQDIAVTALEPREKAAILLLLRESDLEQLLPTLTNFEERFNGVFRYPYVFLSSPDAPPFSAHFQQAVQERLPAGAVTEWGVVPLEHWSIPEWMDEEKVMERLNEQVEEHIQYGGRLGYHHMCRFYSGFFARHPLLEKYDWYWRLEPGVHYYCDISYDPFRMMAQQNKVYGFVITILEEPNTIPTLFNTIYDYAQREKLVPGELWDFLTTREGGKVDYNLCHFWTNFEIGDLRFFRGAEYQLLFNELDRAGGFFNERWGDAPIRSLALGLLADTDRVHYFDDIGYKHDWFVHCPQRSHLGCNCDCPEFGPGITDIDNHPQYTCLPKWREISARGGLDTHANKTK